ncbi:MAG: DNA polymerase III subunit beta [Patescibacteria group bacterium]
MIKTQMPKQELLQALQKVQKITGTVKLESETSGIVFVIKENSVELLGISETRYIKHPVKTEFIDLSSTEKKLFKIATDFRKLTDILTGMSDVSVKIEIETSKLLVKGKSSKFTLPVNEKNLPDDDVAKKNESVIDPKDLVYVLKNTQFSSSSEASRPVLSSIKAVSMGQGSGSLFVTTDGFRLSLVRSLVSFSENQKVQIPINFFREVSTLIFGQDKKIIVSFTDDDRCVFEQEGIIVWTKMVTGDFPPYEKVLFPEYAISISCGRDALLEATKSISVMSRDYSNILVVELKKDTIVVRTKKEVGGENEVVVDVQKSSGLDDRNVVVAFNAKYLADFLNVVSDDVITLRINRPDSPALFIPGQIDPSVSAETLAFRHIIMPVRISE